MAATNLLPNEISATNATGAVVLPIEISDVNEDIEAALDDFLLQLPSFDDDTDVLGGGAALPAVNAPQAMTVDRASEVVINPLAQLINPAAVTAAAAPAGDGNGSARRPSSSSPTPPSSAAPAQRPAPAPAQRPARGPSLASLQGASAPHNGKASTLERNREAQRRFRERQRSRVGQLERAAAARPGGVRIKDAGPSGAASAIRRL